MGKPSRDLTEGSIVRNIWQLSLPIMVGNLLQNAFNIVDMIFVGRLGPSSIAAVGMSGIMLGMLYVAIFGIYMGTVALVARFIGAKNKPEAERVAMQSIILGLLCYVVIAATGYPLASPILKALGATDEVALQGVKYIRIMFVGSFTMILSIILGSVLRAAGDALTPMIIMGVSTVVNICLDPLMIFGYWGFPRLGVAGSAVATVIARGVGVAILLYIFRRGKAVIHLSIRNAKVDFSVMLRIMRIGVFSSLQGILRNLGGLVLTRLVSVYGTYAVAAYMVGMRLQMIVLMPGFGMATAVATLVGQNLGAKKPDRAERSAWATVAIGAGIMASLGIIYIAFAGIIIRIFNDHPEVLRIGVVYLRILPISYGFIGLAIIIGRALNGAGDTISPMVTTAIGLLGFRIGLSLLFAQQWGIMGIWVGITCSSILQSLMVAFWFNTGRWKLKQV